MRRFQAELRGGMTIPCLANDQVIAYLVVSSYLVFKYPSIQKTIVGETYRGHFYRLTCNLHSLMHQSDFGQKDIAS